MKKIAAISEAAELGAHSAIEIDGNEIKKINIIEDELISFAEENMAILNEGEGDMILIDIRGEQRIFPVIGLADAIADFATNQIGI